jgi:glycosyltransferase involved in cell wall biosynthesis
MPTVTAPDIRPPADRTATGRPIAYVMEQTLGNTTHYLNLRRAHQPGSSEPRWIPIEYRKSMLPWTFAAGRLARKALLPILDDVAGIFLHTMTLAPGVADLFARKPIVISGDATPFAKREMRTAYGLGRQRPLAEFAKREMYRWIFRRAAGFVVWSHWAKQSLVRDYGCRDDDVAVIPPGIDLDLFVPGDRDHELPRILFVGGDFERKGGDLLLRVFRKHLQGHAELVLVTRDPVPEEPGVFVHRNVQANSDALRRLYATSDVFALPTRADCYAIVCMEALAAGMPVVTTRIGGIPDIVLEGMTGHSVEVDDEQALTEALLSLVHDPARRREMSLAARADAIARFGANANAQALFDFVRSRC